MAFPNKFKHLLETKHGDVEEPGIVWVTYAVCGIENESCGWGGWILESAEGPSGQLPAYTKQICPSCGKELFRSEVAVKFVPSEDQTPTLEEGRDYETEPMEYD